MRGQDPELERLRHEMDAAQRQIDSAKAALDAHSARRDSVKLALDRCKSEISFLKAQLNQEYDAIRACRAARDRYSADQHRYSADSLKASLQRQYEMKDRYYEQMNGGRGGFDTALAELRSAQERRHRASDAFHARLEQLKGENQRARAKWHETRCKVCGATIRYHED